MRKQSSQNWEVRQMEEMKENTYLFLVTSFNICCFMRCVPKLTGDRNTVASYKMWSHVNKWTLAVKSLHDLVTGSVTYEIPRTKILERS